MGAVNEAPHRIAKASYLEDPATGKNTRKHFTCACGVDGDKAAVTEHIAAESDSGGPSSAGADADDDEDDGDASPPSAPARPKRVARKTARKR